MNKELELEANNYVSNKYLAQESEALEDFIAGATSKYVERQKLEFAIEQLKEHIEHPTKPGYKRHDVLAKSKELEQKLSEL